MRSRWIGGAALVLAVTLSLVQSVPVDKQAAISSSFRSKEPQPPAPPVNGVYVPNFPPAETAIPNGTNISFDKSVNTVTRSTGTKQIKTKGKVAALTDSAKTIAAPTLAYADLVKGRASSLTKEFHKGLLGQRLVHFAHTYGLQLNPFTQPLGAMSQVGGEKRRVWVWQIVDIPSVQRNGENLAYTKPTNATTLIRFSFSAFAHLEEYLLVDILPVGANSSSTRSCLSGMLRATNGAHTVGLIMKLKGDLIPKSCPFERSALLQIYERFVLRVFGAHRNFIVDKQTTSFPYTKHQLFVSFAQNFIPAMDEKDVITKAGYTPRAWNNCSVVGSQRASDILRCTTVEYLEYYLTTLNSSRAAVLREELISTLPVDPASVGLRPLTITNTNVLGTPMCRGHQPLSWVITSWLQDIKALLATANDMLGYEQIGAVKVTVKKIHRVYRLLQLIQEDVNGPRLYHTLTSVKACAHKEKRADWF